MKNLLAKKYHFFYQKCEDFFLAKKGKKKAKFFEKSIDIFSKKVYNFGKSKERRIKC